MHLMFFLSSSLETGLAISELSKSVPELHVHHSTVPELSLTPPFNSPNSRPCGGGVLLDLFIRVPRGFGCKAYGSAALQYRAANYNRPHRPKHTS